MTPTVDQPEQNPEPSRPGRRAADFEPLYAGTPPWDIGRPQPCLLALAQAGGLQGRVLDVGCGTGEHALMAAQQGLPATGLDLAPTAIAKAKAKARERGLAARFLVADALELAALAEVFDTVVDSGVFHVFDDEERSRYVASLHAALVPSGRYYLLCFSEHQPGDWGPRRVTQDEIRASFAQGWRVDSIDAVTMEVSLAPEGVAAWLAAITRS